MAEQFVVGEVVRLQARIVDIDQQDVDPGSVAITVKSPDVVTVYLSSADQVVRTSVGNYHVDIELDSAGVWIWRWETEEPHIGAAEGLLMVTPSMIA